MKALVTGISGFAGTYLSQKLLDNGYEVTGIARRNQTFNKDINFIACDILDEEKLRNVLQSEKPDEIYHLAGTAFVPISYKEPKQTYRTIVDGTLGIYEVLRSLDISPRVLYVSSAAVYGEGIGIPFKETDPLSPTNPYAGAKACADLISEQYAKAYQMNVIRVRPFNHTGPGQSPSFVCSSFAKQIAEMELSGKNVINVGNIHVKRDFLDVRDVVDAYILLMKSGARGDVYNVSSQSPVSVSELLHVLAENSTLNSLEVKVDPDKIRPNETKVKIGDASKITSETGWKPIRDIKHTMWDLLDYWRKRLRS
ncbi:GDP-mannose 4,6-dehydratase [Paenibacillus sp. alder61]|uniref:GDP-mannose 4,6-dehydratase n=1 Tax=Paenibacillus sp. alder61 TaxID=2862948 RepID=UPI001CD7C3A0|nr:GDP-mannose 4,6-dehydratase [Paenibacillus sp. alder61]MCA1293926.1 GDP-mannose 4,6-dehydratase [Paenibacillus sp. alder61]